MRVSKTYTYIIFGAFIVLFCLSLFAGFIIGRRRSDIKIAETQLIVDRLTERITELNGTIGNTKLENERLTKIYEQDRETIGELESTNKEFEITNKEIARLLDEQERIIKELTTINTGIRDSSDTVTNGLGRAIEEVNEIIADIQAREN